jgi:hypothetical protein
MMLTHVAAVWPLEVAVPQVIGAGWLKVAVAVSIG